ncbi:MAG: NrsF family protein [Vicinamibacterales bacterium]
MSHERLIAELVADLTPVTPLPSPRVRAARWLLLSVAVVALAVAIRGVRSNWAMVVADPAFLVTTALMLATGVTASMLTMALAVPGALSRAWVRWIPPTLLVLWLAVLLADAALGGTPVGRAGWGTSCLWKTWGIGLGPAAVLLTMARGAAPLDWRWTAGMAAIASLAFGVIGTDMICPLTSHAHILAWHFLPVACSSAAVFAIVAVWTRWRA